MLNNCDNTLCHIHTHGNKILSYTSHYATERQLTDFGTNRESDFLLVDNTK